MEWQVRLVTKKSITIYMALPSELKGEYQLVVHAFDMRANRRAFRESHLQLVEQDAR